jgi:hypothetical protein
MAEHRSKLSPIQWNNLWSISSEIQSKEAELTKLRQTQGLVMELILDAHGIWQAEIQSIKGIDQETKELVIELKTKDTIQTTDLPTA